MLSSWQCDTSEPRGGEIVVISSGESAELTPAHQHTTRHPPVHGLTCTVSSDLGAALTSKVEGGWLGLLHFMNFTFTLLLLPRNLILSLTCVKTHKTT